MINNSVMMELAHEIRYEINSVFISTEYDDMARAFLKACCADDNADHELIFPIRTTIRFAHWRCERTYHKI